MKLSKNQAVISMFFKPLNKEKFDMELFKNPTNEYRAAPFWSWNALLTKERLEEQIECFKSMGFGGFYMHPRSGMETEYLSEEYLDRIGDCIKKAQSEEMLSCLYDEDRWPSGFGGGLVTQNPKFRQRMLIMSSDKTSIPKLEADKEKAVNEGEPYLIGCYDVEFNKNGYLKSYRKIAANENAKNVKYYAYSKTAEISGRQNNQTTVDYLQKESMEKFIEITHKKYYEKFGKHYGKNVPTIFTDEPRFGPCEQISENNDGKVYWSYDFDKSFKEEYGYDIVENLPKLFWDEDGTHSFERYDFFNHASELFRKNFFEQIQNTTKQQGLLFCGHMMKEEQLAPALCWGGDIMRMCRHFDIPGMDMLFDFLEFLTAKQVQSIVRQHGKEAMLSELYGVTGWDFDFKCLKMQGDWQAVMGVSVRVPHLAMYSMKGCAKRDYPASFNYQSPWHMEFKYLEDHFARINTVFESLKDIVDVAVIHPIESVMLSLGAAEKSEKDIKIQEDNIQKLMSDLLYSNIDFDFINEADVLSQKVSCDKKLNIGKMSYSAVIVPQLKTLRKTTLKMLEEFKKKGGKVIFMGESPEYLDGRKSDAIKPLYNICEKATDKENLIELLEKFRTVKITSQEENKKIYRLSEGKGGKWLFVARAERMGKTAKERSSLTPEKTVIEICGEYGVTVYNTLTGETEKADFEIKNGKTYVYKDWFINDSLLIKLTEEITERKVKETVQIPYKILIPESYTYKRSEQNCAVLDICSVSTDGISYNEPQTVLKQGDILCEELGITPTEAQPYIIKNPRTFNTFTKYKFSCESELEGISLALERAEESEIYFNGKEIAVNVTGYYVDKDIKKIPLPNTQKGVNELVIMSPISEVRQLEPSYLLGEFNTEIKDNVIFLKPIIDNKIDFNPIGEQGMDFYGGNLTYKTEIECESGIAEIVIPTFTAPCIKVFVDGEDKGLIALSPFSLKFPITAGKHKIEFLCYGNRNNTFGPIHNKRIADPDYYIGPWSWERNEENYVEDYNFQKIGILKAPEIRLYK
jgi:hypothetical protein